MRVRVHRAVGFLALFVAALGTAAEPRIRSILPEAVPWARSLLRSRGDGAGAGLDAALTVIQTEYLDPADGNVVLLHLTCSVEVAWTNPGPLPSYYLAFIDDEAGLTTDSGARTSITLERISPGLHEVTLVGFLRASPGDARSLYRGRLLRAPCLIESCDPAPRFIRGNCGGSRGDIDVSSAIYGLNFLFLGGDAPPCLAACDSDANGIVVITDPIYILNYLFLGGPPPAGWVDEDRDGTLDPFCETALPDQCAIGQADCASDS